MTLPAKVLIGAGAVCVAVGSVALMRSSGLFLLGTLGAVLIAVAGLVDGLLRNRGRAHRLPALVGRTRLHAGTALRVRTVVTILLALGLPLLVLSLLALMPLFGWMVVCAVGYTTMRRSVERPDDDAGWPASRPEIAGALQRLCVRADMPIPEARVRSSSVATAWTENGRIHLTEPLVQRLDAAQLEGVLAHELAHIAHRDAAAMDLTTADTHRLEELDEQFGTLGLLKLQAALHRRLTASLSRSREFAADAAAATLTGNPAALASALLALDPGAGGPPADDLRGRAALSIVPIGPARTHPPVAERVARLQAMEARLQA